MLGIDWGLAIADSHQPLSASHRISPSPSFPPESAGRSRPRSSGRRCRRMINSVREPSLIMPNFCPRASTSPGRRSQTIRRAMAPEICRTTIRRCGGDFLLQADPRVLVADRAFGIQGVEKLAGRVPQGNHPRLGRGSIQVYVEDRQEDADPHGRPADELVVLQPRDLDHLAVGRRDQQPGLGRNRAAADRGRSRRSGTAARAGTMAEIPIAACRPSRSSAPTAASPSVAARPVPSGQTAGGRASGTGRRPGPNRTCSGCGSTSDRGDRGFRAAPRPRRPAASAAMRRT